MLREGLRNEVLPAHYYTWIQVPQPTTLSDQISSKLDELKIECSYLGDDVSNHILKCLVVYKLGVHLETFFAQATTAESLKEHIFLEIDALKTFVRNGRLLNRVKDANLKANSTYLVADIENDTQKMYGHLWTDFDAHTYSDDTFTRLDSRLTRNDVDVSWFRGKLGLDAGCGGGRYTAALARYGFKQLYGIDLSKKGIPDAKSRLTGTNVESTVRYMNGNVLELPFKNNSFDFVFSNGVLHHTLKPAQGIKECYRVLKPGGKVWLYLWWNDGLINAYWELSRSILSETDPVLMKNLLATLGLPPGRRFYFIDPWFVPIRQTYSPAEVEALLSDSGFLNLKRLIRGYDTDTCELAHKLGVLGKFIYGEGDLRYIATK